MDSIHKECSVRFTRIMPICNESIKIMLSYRWELVHIPDVASTNFFIHDIFNANDRAVERIRGYVAIFILVAVWCMVLLDLKALSVFLTYSEAAF